MRSLFSLAGAVAGMMTAATVFGQTPHSVYRPSSFQPAPHQTYYAQPSHGSAYGHAAQLWQPGATNVSYRRQPQVPPMGGGYAEELNANPYREQLEGHRVLAAPYGSPNGCATTAMGGSCNAVDTFAFCGDTCGPRWFGYAGGLIMTKDREREIWMSYDSGDLGAAIMGTHDAEMDWSGGYELRLGRHFGCQNWAWETVFWAVRGESEFNAYGADMVGNLRTPLEVNFQGLAYDGSALQDFYGTGGAGAQVHRLRRSFDFYNVEVNVFQDPNLYMSYNDCGGCSVGVVGGLRFFRFSDGLQFSSNTVDDVFVGGVDEVHYGIDADNNLFGAQIGMLANYSHRSWNLYGGAKVGVFGNHINHRSRIYGAAGNAYIDNNLSPNDGREFDIRTHRNSLSFLCELDLGASYQITQRLSVRGGYRALALTGMALSTDQIPQNFEDLGVIASTQASSSVVLHGAYIGGEFVW